MPTPKPRGNLPSAQVEEIVRRVLLGGIGAANFQDRSMGFGTPKHGALVGKQNGVWSNVTLSSTTDLENVDVQHNLGAIPVFCRLWHSDNPATPDVYFQARPVNQHKWTKTTCVVAVVKSAGGGSVDGTVLTFLVGGE